VFTHWPSVLDHSHCVHVLSVLVPFATSRHNRWEQYDVGHSLMTYPNLLHQVYIVNKRGLANSQQQQQTPRSSRKAGTKQEL
jgi:hypothetical protein